MICTTGCDLSTFIKSEKKKYTHINKEILMDIVRKNYCTKAKHNEEQMKRKNEIMVKIRVDSEWGDRDFIAIYVVKFDKFHQNIDRSGYANTRVICTITQKRQKSFYQRTEIGYVEIQSSCKNHLGTCDIDGRISNKMWKH